MFKGLIAVTESLRCPVVSGYCCIRHAVVTTDVVIMNVCVCRIIDQHVIHVYGESLRVTRVHDEIVILSVNLTTAPVIIL